MALTGSYSLKWHGHGVHLNSSISGLLRSDVFTDVIVATADGLYYPAHQFVLSACSPYLHRMFVIASNGSKTNAKAIIVLPSEIDHSTFGILLQYIYRGEAIVSHDELPNIMKAAEILEIRGLCQGKDRHDGKSSHKNNQDLRNKTELPVKSKLSLLVPKVTYGSKTIETGIINNSHSSSSIVSNSSGNVSNSTKRVPVITNSTQEKKKLKKDSDILELDADNEVNVEESMIEKIIVAEEIQVKEEPVDWGEPSPDLDEDGVNVKQEVVSEEEVEVEVEESCYVPLTCDLCQQTFRSPALWVRHIEQAHQASNLVSRRSNSEDGAGGGYTPLHCELCQQVFTVPADWVRHIKTHTEEQLALTNKKADTSSSRERVQITCPVCGKVLQSQASMQIHARTHTGERPFLCKICGREFNVKSNYLRHMRTLHNKIILHNNSNTVD